MLEILGVEPGSIGEELELESGDVLLSVNGQDVRDLVDAQVLLAPEELVIEVRRKDGELWELEIEKDIGDSLGLHFPHPEPSQCGNSCLFCFVHQLPRGMRRSLYVKDEDYRFSFLYGSYVTLSNIGEEEIRRIIEQHLSPLYVSVHATDEALRSRLLGRVAPPILPILQRLVDAGIAIHTQIVLCPGINDGRFLEKTVEDLHALAPGIWSLAVVPVGLTGHRQHLPDLRPPTPEEAGSVVDLLHGYQGRFAAESASRFVFAADELYLRARREFPPLQEYESLPQLENGVGMIPLFRAQAQEVLCAAVPLKAPVVSTFTGESFAREMQGFLDGVRETTGAIVHLHPIVNRFFGGHVSVTGLITGRDVIEQLRGKELGDVLLVPDVVLREGEEVFLDDVSLEDLGRELDVEIMPVESTPSGLVDALEFLSDELGDGHG